MLLVIDIGNTNIVAGVFQASELACSWRIATRPDRTADEYSVLFSDLFDRHDISQQDIESIVISSVVPPLNDCFLELSEKFFGSSPTFVDPASQRVLEIRYEPLSDVGADRIVNAVAALTIVEPPLIVVDFGTATTFDAVDASRAYVGGVIAPGAGISAEALFLRASRLPRIEIHKPEAILGTSTVKSMQSGLYYGYVGLVDGIIERMKRELGEAAVIATGGLAPLISQESVHIQSIEEDLTLLGLREFHLQSV